MSRGTLTTGISTMLQKLSELFSAKRTPAGYRPGVTLEHVRRNLGLARFEQTGSTELGLSPIPSLAEIAADPQFSPREISREDFETSWTKARGH